LCGGVTFVHINQISKNIGEECGNMMQIQIKKIMEKNIEKYNTILKEYYDKISLENKILYEELANKAINLGFVPSRDKTKQISISFRNNKIKYTIMKFAEEPKDVFIWKFKFAANDNYSNIFDESAKNLDEGIRNNMAKYGFKNVTCFGCAKCVNEKKLFYSIEYEDGRKYKLCGDVTFVHINKISKNIVEEAGNMMQIQIKKIME